jgi:hypothetical protein
MEFFVFSPYSQNVPIKFSSSQSVPKCVLQDVPNSTWVLSHMVCPKYNSHVYYLTGAEFESLNGGIIAYCP